MLGKPGRYELARMNPPSFYDLMRRHRGVPGEIIAVFLATFNPIADHGIDAVNVVMPRLADLLKEVAPGGAVIGRLLWYLDGIFMPHATRTDSNNLAEALRAAAADRDVELSDGEWVEIRVAAGHATVDADETCALRLLRTAVQGAQQDQGRYPADWHFAIPDLLGSLEQVELRGFDQEPVHDARIGDRHYWTLVQIDERITYLRMADALRNHTPDHLRRITMACEYFGLHELRDLFEWLRTNSSLKHEKALAAEHWKLATNTALSQALTNRFHIHPQDFAPTLDE